MPQGENRALDRNAVFSLRDRQRRTSKQVKSKAQKNRPGFGGLADATERGESSGAVLPELDVLKEAAREAAN
jgi:hypothetical protein